MRIAHFLPVAIVLILSWSFGGCRLGNTVQRAENPDQISGYYETDAQELEYCADSTGICKSVNPVEIPSTITQLLTNPVLLAVTDLADNKVALANYPDQTSYIRGKITDGTNLSLSKQTVLFSVDDTGCQADFAVVIEGTYSKYDAAKTTKQGVSSLGRLDLKTAVGILINDYCDDMLIALQACYLNEADCWEDSYTKAENHAFAQALYSPFIEAGVMTAQDITATRTLVYRATYQ